MSEAPKDRWFIKHGPGCLTWRLTVEEFDHVYSRVFNMLVDELKEHKDKALYPMWRSPWVIDLENMHTAMRYLMASYYHDEMLELAKKEGLEDA